MSAKVLLFADMSIFCIPTFSDAVCTRKACGRKGTPLRIVRIVFQLIDDCADEHEDRADAHVVHPLLVILYFCDHLPQQRDVIQ